MRPSSISTVPGGGGRRKEKVGQHFYAEPSQLMCHDGPCSLFDANKERLKGGTDEEDRYLSNKTHPCSDRNMCALVEAVPRWCWQRIELFLHHVRHKTA